MKRSLKSLVGFSIGATDGEIGKVSEFYFDDATWKVKYIVVDTGNWLSGRKVLISPQALGEPDWERKVFPANLTKDQVKHSPDIDTDKPVSKQHESLLYEHYAWSNYWGGGLWSGGMGTAGMIMPASVPLEEAIHSGDPYGAEKHPAKEKIEQAGDPHLRSTEDLKGYTVKATDDAIGDIADFVLDQRNLKIDYLVIATGNWFTGKKVLLSPALITDIDWETETVFVSVPKQAVKNCPEYDEDDEVTDDYADKLNEYYQGVSYSL